MRSVKEECLDRMIELSGSMLEHVLRQYDIHFNRERPHQGEGSATGCSTLPLTIGPARRPRGSRAGRGWAACSGTTIETLAESVQPRDAHDSAFGRFLGPYGREAREGRHFRRPSFWPVRAHYSYSFVSRSRWKEIQRLKTR